MRTMQHRPIGPHPKTAIDWLVRSFACFVKACTPTASTSNAISTISSASHAGSNTGIYSTESQLDVELAWQAFFSLPPLAVCVASRPLRFRTSTSIINVSVCAFIHSTPIRTPSTLSPSRFMSKPSDWRTFRMQPHARWIAQEHSKWVRVFGGM